MKILLIGAGQVGATIAEALYEEHDLTVVDVDSVALSELSFRLDISTVEGNGASRRVLQSAGIARADLVIAGTSRDEINIIASMFGRHLSEARTIVRVANIEYLEAWQERQVDVDFMVSSEVETAYAISSLIGVPAARQTDIFADGLVQIVEFDVPADVSTRGIIGTPFRAAHIPDDSKVAGIIREDRMTVPRGDDTIELGDRIVVIGSPDAAKEWSRIFAADGAAAQVVDDVVLYGAGRAGLAIAQTLLEQGARVRVVEGSYERASFVAESLPDVRVFHARGIDAEFMERERIGRARAAIFAMNNDAKNLYAATLARLHGVDFTIAVADNTGAVRVLEAGGVDVAINPRSVTAEEIVRFAHDPRIRQLAMLEGDRYEVLDITVRGDSEFVGKAFSDLPMSESLIGAIVRDGSAIFPHGDDMLLPGDRAIIFTESERVATVERAL
jgi:trk system potassium uptake protein TrkA